MLTTQKQLIKTDDSMSALPTMWPQMRFRMAGGQGTTWPGPSLHEKGILGFILLLHTFSGLKDHIPGILIPESYIVPLIKLQSTKFSDCHYHFCQISL